MEPRPIPANGSAALEVVRPANVVSADEWNERREQFIRQNYCNGAPDPEASAFITICKRRGLAPEEKQIYLIKRGGNWTVQTSIDGYRLIAERTAAYAGSDEPIFVESGERLANGRPFPLKATATVYKIVAGVRCPFTASAFWDEYNAGTNLWLTMPHVMLAKCAESQALRKAFPADLSGIYTVEEMDQAERDEAPRARATVASGPPETVGGHAQAAMKALHAAAKNTATHEQLHDLGVAAYGVPSLSDCDTRQLNGLRCVVRDCTIAQFAAVLDVAQSVDTATDREFLDGVAEQVTTSDLPEMAKRLLMATISRVDARLQGAVAPAPVAGDDAP